MSTNLPTVEAFALELSAPLQVAGLEAAILHQLPGCQALLRWAIVNVLEPHSSNLETHYQIEGAYLKQV